MSRRSVVAALVAACAVAVPAAAQVRQYTPAGGGGAEAPGRKERLEKAVENARWRLGSVRVDPAFWLSDLAWYDDPQPDSQADFSARAGAGLRFYQPVGSKTTLAAFVLPEYVWWKEREDERGVNQRFGLGSFTYFNRLAIEVSAARDEKLDFVTAEELQRANARSDRIGADLEVPLGGKLTAYARGSRVEFESLAADQATDAFSELDRIDFTYRGGVRYYPAGTFYLGAGVGASESDFADQALDRSNSGDFWYAELGIGRPKLKLHVEYEANDLEGEPGSELGRFTGATGQARLDWLPRDRFGLRVYASRGLAYSVRSLGGSAYVDEVAGAGVLLGLGWRLRLDLFAETGTLGYEEELGGAGRVDDVEAYGAFLTVELGERLELGAGYRRREVTRPGGLPGEELEELRAALSFGLSADSGTFF